MSRIDQTAAGISSVVSQVGTVTAVFDKDHPGGYAIGDRVLHNGTAYRFTQAHAQGTDWTGTDVVAIPVMQTEITRVGQTADSVYSEVVAARDGQSNLKSRIDQEAGKISQVVTAVGKDGKVTAASIVTAINNQTGEGIVDINADRVKLTGGSSSVTLNDKIVIDSNGYTQIKGVLMVSGTGTGAKHVSINNGKVTAGGGVDISSGQALNLIGSQQGEYYSLTADNIKNHVTDIQVLAPSSGSNTYTLQKKTVGNTNWQDAGTFSRATSLSGGWSGATYTVTASPQGQAWSIDFVRGSTSDATLALELGTGTVSQSNEKYLDFPVYIGSDNPSGQMTPNVTINKSINASAVWQKGYDAGAGSVTPTLHIGSTWDYDENSDWYQKTVQIWNGTSVLATDYVDLPTISGTRVTLTKGTISTTNTYTGSYSIQRSSGGVVTVSDVSGAGFTVGVNALSLALVLGTPVCSLGASGTANWNSTSHQYEYTVSSSLSVDGTGNVLTRQTGTLTMTPTDAINYGKTLVSIDTATITQITASASMRAASASVYIKLSNGDEKTLTNVDVSTFYQAGLDGQAQPSGRANVRLVDNNDAFIKTATKTIDVSGVYQKGVDDRSDYGYAYIYASGNERRCAFRSSASSSGDPAHYVSANTKVHLEEDPDHPATSGWVKVSYEGETGYIGSTLVHKTAKSGPNIRTSGWWNERIVGAYSTGFTGTANVGIQITSGGRFYVVPLHSTRAEVMADMDNIPYTSYGSVKVYSSYPRAIGRTAYVVCSDSTILSSYTILDEDA